MILRFSPFPSSCHFPSYMNFSPTLPRFPSGMKGARREEYAPSLVFLIYLLLHDVLTFNSLLSFLKWGSKQSRCGLGAEISYGHNPQILHPTDIEEGPQQKFKLEVSQPEGAPFLSSEPDLSISSKEEHRPGFENSEDLWCPGCLLMAKMNNKITKFLWRRRAANSQWMNY